MTVTLGLAFLAGLVSCVSPCVLPVLPVFAGYVAAAPAGPSALAGLSPFAGPGPRAAGFLLGFLGVFVLVWASLGVLGFALFQAVPVVRQASGALIVVMGILAVAGRHPLARLPGIRAPMAAGGPVLLGAGVAVGWTPCIGPTLGSILTLAAASPTVGAGSLLLVAYALGLAVPFVAVLGAYRRFRGLSAWLAGRPRSVELVSGILVAAVGILVYEGSFARLSGLFRVGL